MWVNLTVSETNKFINLLKNNHRDIEKAKTGLSITSKVSEILGLASDLAGQPEFSFLFELLSLESDVGVLALEIFSLDNLLKIAKEGHGAISFRFLFGFIFTGVKPAYKVVQQ